MENKRKKKKTKFTRIMVSYIIQMTIASFMDYNSEH